MEKDKLIEFWESQMLGSYWINNSGYKVKLLDMGENDVWLLYLRSNNKTSWEIGKFLKEYTPITSSKDLGSLD